MNNNEQLRECINSGQVSAAQVVAHAENGELSMSMFASREDFDEAVDERKCLEQLKDVTAEQRSKFEAWSTSTEPCADVREMLTHRRPDGQYSMLTMRAGFVAWIGGALTERETNAAALAAERAEVVRLIAINDILVAALKLALPRVVNDMNAAVKENFGRVGDDWTYLAVDARDAIVEALEKAGYPATAAEQVCPF